MKINSDRKKPIETLESLRALRRRIYLWALIAALLANLIGWIPKLFTGTASPFEQVIFPVVILLCLVMLLSLWRNPISLAWIESTLFALTALSLLGRFFEVLFVQAASLTPDHLAVFSDLLYWFPLVYVLAFLIFESRRRLLVGSLLFFAVSAALGLTHAILVFLSTQNAAELYLMARFFLANAVYIFLLMVSIRMNEQYVRMHTLAETMTLLAHTDALIQIANRRELEGTIIREIDQSMRYLQPLSMVFFDLDHFKVINDNYGHEVGDNVLKETAIVAQNILRLSDQLGRWGGEEFLVVAPHTNAEQACRAAERLRMAISLHLIDRVGHITASFGVAEYHKGESPGDWLKRADEALYTAKQSGRNRVVMK